MSDDDIEIVEEHLSRGGSGGSGVKHRFGRDERYHFMFSSSIPEDERKELFTMIKKLGGYTTGTIYYTSEATHCVVPDRAIHPFGLSVLGSLADHRKKLVNPTFIRDSFQQGQFLQDTDKKHIPAVFRSLIKSRSHGLFRGLRCVVYIYNQEKADRYMQALEDGGAFVARHLRMRHLNSQTHEQIKEKIDFIFTEPDLFNNNHGGGGRELQKFHTKTVNRERTVKVLSKFYIFEYVIRPTTSREERTFDRYQINNYNIMNHLYPTGSTVKRPPQPFHPVPNAKRVKQTMIEEITLDSDEEENEMKDVKPIIKRELITPRTPSEVIDLSSSSDESDEEEEEEEEEKDEDEDEDEDETRSDNSGESSVVVVTDNSDPTAFLQSAVPTILQANSSMSSTKSASSVTDMTTATSDREPQGPEGHHGQGHHNYHHHPQGSQANHHYHHPNHHQGNQPWPSTDHQQIPREIKNAVRMLDEMFPPPKWPQYKVPISPFTMVCTIEDKDFQGEGKSKNEAKLSCSQRAIEAILGKSVSETTSVAKQSNPRASSDLYTGGKLVGEFEKVPSTAGPPMHNNEMAELEESGGTSQEIPMDLALSQELHLDSPTSICESEVLKLSLPPTPRKVVEETEKEAENVVDETEKEDASAAQPDLSEEVSCEKETSAAWLEDLPMGVWVKVPLDKPTEQEKPEKVTQKVTKESVRELFGRFLDRTKRTDECLDVVDAKPYKFNFDEGQDRRCRIHKDYLETDHTGKARSGRVISNEVSLQYYETMALHDEDAWKGSNLDPQCWINAVRELAISTNVSLRLPVEDFRTYFARHFIQHKNEWTSGDRWNEENRELLFHFAQEFFKNFLELQPPTSYKMRGYYLEAFRSVDSTEITSKGFFDFFQLLIQDISSPELDQAAARSRQLAALEYIVDVVGKDFEHWFKDMQHQRYEEELPLVKVLIGGSKASVYAFDEKHVNQICSNYVKFFFADRQTELSMRLANALGKVTSMAALYSSRCERTLKATATIRSTISSKAVLANMLANEMLSQCPDHQTESTRDSFVTFLELLRPSWLASLVCKRLHGKLSQSLMSPDVEELANQMKELGVSKLCATEPCSVLAKILDAETKDLENQVQFNLGRERKKGEIMPLYDDSGIYIEHEEIYEMTKKLVREKLE